MNLKKLAKRSKREQERCKAIWAKRWEEIDADFARLEVQRQATGQTDKPRRKIDLAKFREEYGVELVSVRSCLAEEFRLKGAVTGESYYFEPRRRTQMAHPDDVPSLLATGVIYKTIGFSTGNPCIHGGRCKCADCYGMNCCA